MYEVTALRYGTRETRKSECYSRWDSYGEPDAEIGMDYFFWVLRNGGTAIVVDTGFHPDVGARRRRTCLYPPLDGLRRIGQPESVETVVLTHLHYDHTGNVDALPNAELVVQRERARVLDEGEAQHQQVASLDELRRSSGSPSTTSDCSTATRRSLRGCRRSGSELAPAKRHAGRRNRSGSAVIASDAVRFFDELGSTHARGHGQLRAIYAATPPSASWRGRGALRCSSVTTPEVMTRFPYLATNWGFRIHPRSRAQS